MTASLQGWPTKAKGAPSFHEIRLSSLESNPAFQCPGFDLSFWSIVVKIYPFTRLILGEEGWKHAAQNIFLAHGTISFSQLLKTNLLSENMYSPTQPAFIYLFKFSKIWIKSRIKSKICSKSPREATDDSLVSLLLTLNTFDSFQVFFLSLKI